MADSPNTAASDQSVAGGAFYVLLSALSFSGLEAGAAAVLATFVLRGLAITFNWSLPAYRRKPGRSIEEIEASGK